MDIIKAFTSEQLKETVPAFNIGDTVRVHNKIKEGNRERIQMFEGTVIAKHGGVPFEKITKNGGKSRLIVGRTRREEK